MPAERAHDSADFVVVGSGIAGLTFALSVARRGRVIIVTKKDDAESATNMAQGGIAAVVEGTDSFEQHIRDTLTGGVGLCRREAVEIAVRSGPGAVGRLMSWGARFSTEVADDGSEHFSLGREGGHSMRRIIHAADMTGKEIETALLTAVGESPNIEVWEDHVAIDVVVGESVEGRRCVGVHVLDIEAGAVRTIVAPVTALATGGCGKVYLYTTNPDIASGDGIAIAYRAGVPVRNMEFIQFHPTCLYHPEAKSFLISEAVILELILGLAVVAHPDRRHATHSERHLVLYIAAYLTLISIKTKDFFTAPFQRRYRGEGDLRPACTLYRNQSSPAKVRSIISEYPFRCQETLGATPVADLFLLNRIRYLYEEGVGPIPIVGE